MRLPFQKIKFHSTTFLPIYYLIVIGLLLFLTLLTLFNGVQLSALKNKPAPSLVQMVDGKVVKTAPVDANYRSPEVIKRVVQDWAVMTMSWSGKLPNGSPDPGVEFNGVRVPTVTWTASFILSEDFRRKFLEKLYQISNRVAQDGAQTALSIVHITSPKPISNTGQWRVDVISNLLIFQGNKQESFLPFNKQIYLSTVPLPTNSLTEINSPIQKAVEAAREAGLEIYRIEDLPNPS